MTAPPASCVARLRAVQAWLTRRVREWATPASFLKMACAVAAGSSHTSNCRSAARKTFSGEPNCFGSRAEGALQCRASDAMPAREVRYRAARRETLARAAYVLV